MQLVAECIFGWNAWVDLFFFTNILPYCTRQASMTGKILGAIRHSIWEE